MREGVGPLPEIAIPAGIELCSIEAVQPYQRNARTHSDAQVQQIAASIRKYGWTNPLIVDDEYQLIAGHGRLLAARALGLQKVPIVRVNHMCEADKRAYVIADNQLALRAGWDRELLAAELNDLRNLGLNDLGVIGFTEGELERLLAPYVPGGLTDDDALPDPPEAPISKPGDLWRLGDHLLLCGDVLVEGNLEALLKSKAAPLVFTDPPYNVDYEGKTKKHLRIQNDDLGTSFSTFLEGACRRIVQFAGGAVYICMSSSEIHTLRSAWERAGGKWSTYIIWAKNSFTLGRADYQRQYEPILYGWKAGLDHYWAGGRGEGDVWQVDRPAANPHHPTAKPVALVERAIRNSSSKGDVVLDPFSGGGSTLIACEKLGRHACLMDIDPRYVDATIQRWEEYTGREAIDQDGKSFGFRRAHKEVDNARPQT